MAFDAGSISAKMMLDSTQFNNGVRSVNKELSKLKLTAAGIGSAIKASFLAAATAAVGLGAVIAKMVSDTTKYGEEIYKISRQTGAATEDISKLAYAAKQEGVELQQVGKALNMLSINMFNARGQTNQQSQAFQKMGVSINNMNGSLKSSFDVLKQMSTYFSTAKDKTEALALAKIALGRAGGELIPLLQLGGEEIERLGERAGKLGVIFKERTVAGIKVFADNMTDLQVALQGIGLAVTEAVLPYLIELTDTLANLDYEQVREQVTRFIDKLIELGVWAYKIGKSLQVVWRTMIYGVMWMITRLAEMYSNIKVFFLNVLTHVQGTIKKMLEAIQDFMDKAEPFTKFFGFDWGKAVSGKLQEGIDSLSASIEKNGQIIDQEKSFITELNAETEKTKLAVIEAATAVTKADGAYQRWTEKVKAHSKALVDNQLNLMKTKEETQSVTNVVQIELEKAMGIIKKWADELDTWGTTLGKVATQAMDGFADGTARAFRDALESGKDFVESMKEMMRKLMYDLIEMIISSQIKRMFADLFMPSNAGAGSGNLFSGLFGWLGGLFGGGFQDGTDEVQTTGMYRLHAGESVTPKYDASKDKAAQPLIIYNLITPEAVAFAMSGKEGENLIVNTINQNSLRNGVVRREVTRR